MTMKKFKVTYTAYSNHEWTHDTHVDIIEADSKEDVEKIVRNWDNYNATYFPERIEEYEDQ